MNYQASRHYLERLPFSDTVCSQPVALVGNGDEMKREVMVAREKTAFRLCF